MPLPGLHLDSRDGDLLSLSSGEDSDEDGDATDQTMDHMTAYWKPEQGNIMMLTTSIAEALSALTGSSISSEPLTGRVCIRGGDFSRCLMKLKNLEKLLASAYPPGVSGRG